MCKWHPATNGEKGLCRIAAGRNGEGRMIGIKKVGERLGLID
jgi:hypothetical protein